MKKNILVVTSCSMFFLIAGCNPGKNAAVTNNSNLSDSALFRLVQQQTFQYFWDGAEPVSGLARESFHADDIYPAK